MELNPYTLFRESYSEGLELDPELTVSEWSDQHRILPSKGSSEPGRWRTNRTPYLKEILDCLSPRSPVEKVIFMKASQIGGTEAGNCWISYIIAQAPGPTLVVQPTVELAKRWSVQRLAPTIYETPSLRNKVSDPKSRDSGNTQLVKEFKGGLIVATGANSAVGLRSMPCRYLMLDEIDAYPVDADGEGDPVSLAVKRTATFSRRKVFELSTPTIKDISRIEREYNQSDARRYFVPCPFCGAEQFLKWSNIVWEKDEKGNHLPETASYECESCSKHIEEYHKGEMLAKGRWIATNTNSKPKVAGFHLNALYSPPGWKSWAECASEFLESKSDRYMLKTWTNTILGEVFEEVGEGIEYEYIYTRREDYTYDPLPEKVCLITAGIDTQDDRLCIEVVGWCVGEESYSLMYEELSGNPGTVKVWNKLDDILNLEFNHPTGTKLNIATAFVDSGGHHTDSVYRFCHARQFRRVFACKGVSQPGKPVTNKPTKIARSQTLLYPIGSDTAKEVIYSRLKLGESGKGFMHFPLMYDKDYFLMLTAEKVVTRYTKGFPKREWVKARRRNEALDCRVYAFASLVALNPHLELLHSNLTGTDSSSKDSKPHRSFVHNKGWVSSVARR
jgi:phage terminase large subunit GpA-like protein